jgi:hypothetical protein
MRRQWWIFGLVFAPLLALLGWPLPGTGRTFRALACESVNAFIMQAADAPDVARLLPDTRPGREWHATAAVWNQSGRALRFAMDVDLHQTVYLPLAVFVALVVAGRRAFGSQHFPLRRQVLGIAVLLARSSLRFVLLERQADGVAHRAPLDVLLQILNLSLAAPPGMAYVFPLLLAVGLFGDALSTTETAESVAS